MSERFGVGDYVNIRSKTEGVPDDPGVVVGYVVRVPGHDPWIASENEIHHAAFADVDRTGLNKVAGELVKSAETSITKIIEKATKEAMDSLVADYNIQVKALQDRVAQMASRVETTEGKIENVAGTGKSLMRVLKEVLPPQ
jgi:hypothetical protein